MSDHDKLREAIERCRTQLGRDRVSVRPDVQFGYAGCLARGADIEAICDAAESTLPKTKMVEVWHVEYALRDSTPGCPWVLAVNAYTDNGVAQRVAQSFADHVNYACIRVTGPHMQEIPV